MKKLAALLLWDGADQDAVGGAGEEIADSLLAGEHGHGVAVGLARVSGGKYLVDVVAFGLLHVSVEGSLPGGAAATEGDFGV